MLDDAKQLVDKVPSLNLQSDLIMIAFAHSKELHVKEMADIEKYYRLNPHEFLEFLGRLSALVYKSRTQMLLSEKIERTLIEFFKIINEKIKYPPKTEDDELVSDFEDDTLHLARKKLKEENHEQFLIVDITKNV
jgi:hypothetical protein